MGRTNRHLNDLYFDLISNSPQTVSMDIPLECGLGKISQTTIKQGIILSDWQMNYTSDMNVEGANSEEYIQIIFCMKEGMSWGALNDRYAVHIEKGESCIYKGHGKTEYAFYPKQCDFQFKSIKIPLSYFLKILNEYFEEKEIIAYEKTLFQNISKVKITPYMERILAETKEFVRYRGGLGYLFLEGKVLELLSVYLSEVLELSILISRDIYLSRTDRDLILDAKSIIDSQLAYAPSCEELAKQVKMSTSKFRKGFSNIFGMPVHTYIINQRLEKAAGLLIESDLHIYQIASLVGYAKSSNFAAAFKKKYGVIPKRYREQREN